MQHAQARQLGVGELVDGAIELWRRNLGTLLATAAVVILPSAALVALARALADPQRKIGEHLLGGAGGFVMAVTVALALVACIHAAGQAYLGNRPHWFDSVGHVAGSLPRLGKASMLVGGLVQLGLAVLFVPGIVLAVLWSLALPVVVFEGGDCSAVKRSYHLVTSRWSAIFAVIGAGMVAVAASQGLLSLAGFATGFVPGADATVAEFARWFLAAIAVPLVAVPVGACLLTIAYVDTTLRAGELDLDLMGKHLDLADAPPTVVDLADAPVVLRRSIDDLVRRGERDLRRLTEKSREVIEQLSRPSDRGEPAIPLDESRPLAIMFTDVDGSTAITERLGDLEARRVLRASEDLVRGAVVAHGGRTVRHTGDGCMACFPSASQALECALMIEREHEVRNRVAGVPVTLRVGINAGEPVLDGSGVLGLAVHVAECIIREAGPGEILVSDVARQLAAGKGFLFEDRGAAPLGDLSEPVRLYALLGR